VNDQIVRPWWAEDLRNALDHFGKWFVAYLGALVGGASVLQLALPELEGMVSPHMFTWIKAGIGILLLVKGVKDATRSQDARSSDQPAEKKP
jgi:hypothetical protein